MKKDKSFIQQISSFSSLNLQNIRGNTSNEFLSSSCFIFEFMEFSRQFLELILKHIQIVLKQVRCLNGCCGAAINPTFPYVRLLIGETSVGR